MTTKAEADLKQMMEQFRDLRLSMGKPDGYTYYGMEDFLLRHGVWHKPVKYPRGMIPGAPKCCFANALIMAVLRGYHYIEGLAIPDIRITLPVYHGWNIDHRGRLVDTTWENTGLAYCGVEFSIGRADYTQWFDDASVLDNPRNQNAIYKEPWTGENFNLVWRKSKALKQIEEAKAKRNAVAEIIGKEVPPCEP